MSCLEDMANLELALEIMNTSNEKLSYYIKIISQNKKLILVLGINVFVWIMQFIIPK